MSSNNEIVITRKQNGLYKIADVDVEEGTMNLLVKDDVDGLDVAVEFANKYLEDCDTEGYPVEYGLRIEK